MRWRSSLLVMVGLVSGLAVSDLWSADPVAEQVKVSAFAPAADLAAQIEFYTNRIKEAVADKNDYDDAKQSRVSKDAQTLAGLALCVALSDEESPGKSAAPQLHAQACAIAEKAKDAAAVTELLAGKNVPAPQNNLNWQQVGSVEPLMRQAGNLHSSLKRGVTNASRFEKTKKLSAEQATVLAVLSHLWQFDHDYASGDKEAQWRQFCLDTRDAAAEVNSAVRAADQPRAAAAYTKLHERCEACHKLFKKED